MLSRKSIPCRKGLNQYSNSNRSRFSYQQSAHSEKKKKKYTFTWANCKVRECVAPQCSKIKTQRRTLKWFFFFKSKQRIDFFFQVMHFIWSSHFYGFKCILQPCKHFFPFVDKLTKGIFFFTFLRFEKNLNILNVGG